MYICCLLWIKILLFFQMFETRSTCGRNRTRFWSTLGGKHCLTAIWLMSTISFELQPSKLFVFECWFYKAMSFVTFNQFIESILAPCNQLSVIINILFSMLPTAWSIFLCVCLYMVVGSRLRGACIGLVVGLIAASSSNERLQWMNLRKNESWLSSQ